MRAPIYARKSTEQDGVNEEDKSVRRQIEHASAYAKKKGWTVAEDHIYSDDGISGAEFKKRPGLLRLMTTLESKPPFQVLIMSEESRLGRESIETSYVFKQIVESGVRVFFYLSDQERKLDTALDKVMLSLTNFASEMEREKASQRTHDALLKKHNAGYVTGCKVFGYDNVEVCGPDGKHSHVERKINDAEAAIVRRIFERYANGEGGLKNITKELNDDRVPPPRKSDSGWDPSCVRAILHRPLYRGIIIWGRTQAILRKGTKTSRKRPPQDWQTIEKPDLRIIPDAIWQRVSAKMQRQRAAYAHTELGRFCGRPSEVDLRSDYLLSGLAQCGLCGASLIAFRRNPRVGQNLYVCAFQHRRGSICVNTIRIPQPVLDGALLDALHAALDESLLAEAVRMALDMQRREQAAHPDQRLMLERSLASVESRLRHLVESIATGKATESVYVELQKEEAAKQVLSSQLLDLERLTRTASADSKQLEGMLKARVADTRRLLGRHVPQARQMLRKLIEGRIVGRPFDDERGRGYEVSATGNYAGLLRVPALLNEGGGEGGI